MKYVITENGVKLAAVEVHSQRKQTYVRLSLSLYILLVHTVTGQLFSKLHVSVIWLNQTIGLIIFPTLTSVEDRFRSSPRQ